MNKSSSSVSSIPKRVYILENDDKGLKKFLEEMATLKKSNSSLYKIEDFVNDEDFYFARQKPLSNEAFPIIVLILTFICVVCVYVCYFIILAHNKIWMWFEKCT